MNYIVIETFDPLYPIIVTNTEGMPLIFETLEQAQLEADDCQKGLIVEYS